MTSFEIAPAATDAELRAFVEIVGVVHPGAGATRRRAPARARIPPETVFLLASLDGEPVGAGTGKASSLGDALYAMARVLPRTAAEASGRALLGALSAHARAVGRRASSDARSRTTEARGRSSTRHGFVVVSRELPVALDLTGVPPSATPRRPTGVELVSLAERPDLAERAYAVEAEAVVDIPVGVRAPRGPDRTPPGSRTAVESPDALLDLSLVALVGGEAVGWSGLAATGEEGRRREPAHRRATRVASQRDRHRAQAGAGLARSRGGPAHHRDDERRRRTSRCARSTRGSGSSLCPRGCCCAALSGVDDG